jgi:hypothetical protein
MEGSKKLPKKEMETQNRHQAAQQRQGTKGKLPRSVKFTTEKHELDHIEDNTKAWSPAWEKTRNIEKWLELHRKNTQRLAWAGEWITSLQIEHELANLSAKLDLEYWIE